MAVLLVGVGGHQFASGVMPSAAEIALNDGVWMFAPMASPSDMRALSLACPALRAVLLPASERAQRSRDLARQLQKLPFEFAFPLPRLGPEVLKETLSALLPLRQLRRREFVGCGAGWAPTDMEHWCFQTSAEMASLVASADAAAVAAGAGAAAVARRGGRTALLFGAVLRAVDADENEPVPAGQVVTAPVGVEWAEGPAADPLQLGLSLVLGPGDEAIIDLELASGGWSPWSESWALSDGTLAARVAVAASLPGGHRFSVLSTPTSSGVDAPGAQAPDGEATRCQAEGVVAFRAALAAAGSAGVRVAVCIGGLGWRKEAPAWCPPEVRRVAHLARPVFVA